MPIKEKIRALLSALPMLNAEEMEILVDKTVADHFEKGTVLLREGQIPTKCYMVVEGCVREYRIVDGLEKSTAFYTEGETFTPQSKDPLPSKHYWECTEDCILTISTKGFEEEIRKALPRLDAVFQEMAIAKMNAAKEEWSVFISSSPEERYLNLLQTKPGLFQRVPHQHIASYLGMTAQSLSRIRKRLIEKEKKGTNP